MMPSVPTASGSYCFQNDPSVTDRLDFMGTIMSHLLSYQYLFLSICRDVNLTACSWIQNTERPTDSRHLQRTHGLGRCGPGKPMKVRAVRLAANRQICNYGLLSTNAKESDPIFGRDERMAQEREIGSRSKACAPTPLRGLR